MPSPTSSSRQPSPYAIGRRLGALGRGARKSLGQHFLNNPAVAQRIVELARLEGTEHVVEIGPGLGALSERLAERCSRLTLVELDSEFAAELRQRFASRHNVHVVEADALRVDLDDLLGDDEAVAIGNLPYNVATAILARLVEEPRVRRIVVMLQLEVARRLIAQPGSRDYGILSVMTQLSTTVELAFKVRPGAFVPPPRVDSAVVRLESRREPVVELRDREGFNRLVRAAFGKRRKQLINSLKSVTDRAEELLEQAGIEPTRRPETLSLAEFAALANCLE